MQDWSDDKPPIVILSPDYDSSNPDHVRRWELAGRPSLTDLDASGQHWRLTIPGDLQSDGSYLPRTLPMPAPVTDVETSTTNFTKAEEAASNFLNGLKGRVVVYLKTKHSDADAVAAGVAFVDPDNGIGKEYDYFVKAGGHPLAAAKLYTKIQSVKKNFAWFDDTVNEIFTAALTRAQEGTGYGNHQEEPKLQGIPQGLIQRRARGLRV